MQKLSKRETRAINRFLKKQSPSGMIQTFLPSGRSGIYLYALILKERPDMAKIGRTNNWNNRRKSYAQWNFSEEDAILSEAVFCIHDEYADLPAIENHILQTIEFPLAWGREWFSCSLEDATRHIDRVLTELEISFEVSGLE